MELKNQVVSLELAQKLKELGVKQESLFFWNIWHGQMDDFLWQIHYGQPVKRGDGVLSEETYSAYTVAELLERLPASTCLVKKTDIKMKQEVRYYAETFDFHPTISPDLHDKNPANALAKLLIQLYENKLINHD